MLARLLLALALLLPLPAGAFVRGGGSFGSAAPSGLPTVSSAQAATYCSRLCTTGYAGPIERVTKPSDGSNVDVASNGDGSPNTTAACAAISPATSAVVNLLYDQSGHGNNAAVTGTGAVLDCTHGIRGIKGVTFDSMGSAYFAIPSAVTGSGQATTVVNVVSYMSSNAAVPSMVGSAYTQAGAISSLNGQGGTSAFQVMNGIAASPFFNFKAVSSRKGRSQPQFTAVVASTTAQTVYEDDSAFTLAAGDAGTWTGGQIGKGGASYPFNGDWYATVVYTTALTGTDVSSLKTWATTKFDLLTTTDTQLVIPGNSITQGYKATLNQNWPTQAEPNFSKRIKVSNQGVSGQTAQQVYTAASSYYAQFDGTLAHNYILAPEPTNDIGGAGPNPICTSGSIVGCGTTAWTSFVLPFIQGAESAGFTVLVPTTTARTASSWGGTSTDQSQREAERLAFNTLVRNNAATYGYTVVDFAGISVLSDPSIATYFNDGLHPTSAGYLAMANYFVSVFNPLLAANDNFLNPATRFAANDNLLRGRPRIAL